MQYHCYYDKYIYSHGTCYNIYKNARWLEMAILKSAFPLDILQYDSSRVQKIGVRMKSPAVQDCRSRW